ncbi:zinc ribbon domain-containing protein [Halopenitus persicus]|nr:zinc ribbon domain-containing protein [Halopenitus persicus]
MGDRPCDRVFCPACDAPATTRDAECPDCGAVLPAEGR